MKMSSSGVSTVQSVSDPCHSTQISDRKTKKCWGNPSVPSAWGNAPAMLTPISLEEIMSEDLAKDLQLKEEDTVAGELLYEDDCSGFKSETANDTSSDLLIAHQLQYEFDKEFDNQLLREEKHYNKNSKLAVTFDKFKICPSWYRGESDDEELPEIDEEGRALDSFEEREWEDPIIPPCGYVKHNNQMITKHDSKINGRRNAQRVMSFPPGINTGDGGGFDMKLSNRVYNELMTSSFVETRKKQRVRDKVEKATVEMALDPKTRVIVYKMINNSILESVNGLISTGKEAAVIHAYGGIFEDVPMPSECALKIFKTCLTDFKTRERYIRDDYRFKDRYSKNNSKATIQLWAEKEFHNLKRLHKCGVPSPKPLLIKKQVLVMSFIGEDRKPASKLKHMNLPYEDWCIAYEQVEQGMMTMFNGCRLVHSDLSEYNILWHDNQCYFIDLGQAVEPVHENAMEYLFRDCNNIIRFFKNKGLTEIPTAYKLFKRITGIDISKEEDIANIKVSEEMWRNACKSPNDYFDFLWEELQNEESVIKKASNHLPASHLDEEIEEEDLPNFEDGCKEDRSNSNLNKESTTPTKSKRKNRKSKYKNSVSNSAETVAPSHSKSKKNKNKKGTSNV